MTDVRICLVIQTKSRFVTKIHLRQDFHLLITNQQNPRKKVGKVSLSLRARINCSRYDCTCKGFYTNFHKVVSGVSNCWVARRMECFGMKEKASLKSFHIRVTASCPARPTCLAKAIVTCELLNRLLWIYDISTASVVSLGTPVTHLAAL
jgi:hypothetical protein